MTVPAQDRFTFSSGNGVTTTFPYTFMIPGTVDDPQFLVYLIEIATDTRTDLTVDVDYSISGLGVEAGGVVTYPLSGAPLPATHRIVIESNMPYEQQTDVYNSGTLYLSAIEDQFDNTTRQVQQIQDRVNRTFSVGIGYEGNYELFPVADKLIGWNSDGTGLENKQSESESAAAAYAAQLAAEAAAESIDTRTVADRTALKALNTASTAVAYLREPGREGPFKWTLGDMTAFVDADTYEALYVESDVVGFDKSVGAWVRQRETLDIAFSWGGGKYGDRSAAADNGAIINSLIVLGNMVGGTLVFGSGAVFNSIPIVQNIQCNVRGAGITYWVKQASNVNKYASPGYIVMVGTGSKDQTLFGVSSMRNWGGDRPNPSARAGYNDTVYRLDSFVNESTDASTRSLKAFSAAWTIFPGAEGSRFTDLRILPDFGGDDGMDGYQIGTGVATDALTDGAWDVGLFFNGARECLFDRCQFVGQWRMRRGVLIAPHRKAWPATIYNTCFKECTVSGLSVRGVDDAPIVARTSATVDIPWADDHPFGADGDLRLILTTGGRAGDDFTYTGMTKVTGGSYDILRFTGVFPDPTSKTYKNCMPYYRGGGTSHLSFPFTEIQGFGHSSDLPSEHEDLGGTGTGPFSTPMNTIELSGNELTEIDLGDAKVTGYETVALYIGDCRETILPRYWEMNNGGRIIAWPHRDANAYSVAGFAASETLDPVFEPHGSTLTDGSLDVRPYITELTTPPLFNDPSDTGFFEAVRLRSNTYGVGATLDKGVYLAANKVGGEVAIGAWNGPRGFFDNDTANFDAFMRYRPSEDFGRLRKDLKANVRDQCSIGANNNEFSRIYASGFISRVLTIGDDAVATFTPPVSGGFIMVTAYSTAAVPLSAYSGMVWVDCGSSLVSFKANLGAGGASLAVTTGVLSGTTGADGVLTISAGTDTVYFENRQGGQLTVRLTFLG